MKVYYDCYPCFLRQSIEAARHAGATDPQVKAVLQSVLQTIMGLNERATPPEIAGVIHRTVRETLKIEDPYEKEKEKSTQEALAIYPDLKKLAGDGSDMGTLLRIAIAGNIIDAGVGGRHGDLWDTVERVLAQPFAIDDSETLIREMGRYERILYLADNAGETVFDRVFIETIDNAVTYVVKGHPVLNDATAKDALAAGLDRCAAIVDNGSDAPGTVLDSCSQEFKRIFESSDLILAKGQANYESLSQAGEKVFCLLQVKCPVIAKDIGAPVGSIVVRRSLPLA
ncbi:ARMT1-like domain-containing protein [uncultured Desulfosarcina sp.]|uniref:damage-control phosphatase ARMT1 family protein n=1 Tax=uncultured Desulfosarcina sp. TaxID=218289 RepID=UPI0029C7D2AF|nr:ARMT1-like domain-containing protein [uncultured Desulfosarcina sp.]